MIPAQIDFPCWRNASYGESLPFVENGQPVDLTGLNMVMTVRRYPTAPDTLFVLNMVSEGQGLRINDPKSGVVDLQIDWQTLNAAYAAVDASQIANQVVRLSYDVIVTYLDNFKEPWLQGVLSINPGVNVNG
jgi:hypothetical protein